jgi:hypothetical protein
MVVTAAKSFDWQAGEADVTVFRRPSGFRAVFCSRCGSPAPVRHENGKVVMIPVGLLEAGTSLEMAQHIFVGSKADWDVIGDMAEQFEQSAPDA